MKPFFLLLLLIASGILFSTFSRPLTLVTEVTRSLGQLPHRLMAKLQVASAAILTSGHVGANRKQSLPGDSWRPAAQF